MSVHLISKTRKPKRPPIKPRRRRNSRWANSPLVSPLDGVQGCDTSCMFISQRGLALYYRLRGVQSVTKRCVLRLPLPALCFAVASVVGK